MTAPAVHAHDVVRTLDGQLHTVDHLEPDMAGDPAPLVTEWTGQQPHPLHGAYQVVYRHHGRAV